MAAEARTRGRPQTPPDRALVEQISVRLTQEQWEWLEACARAAGVRRQAVLRRLIERERQEAHSGSGA